MCKTMSSTWEAWAQTAKRLVRATRGALAARKHNVDGWSKIHLVQGLQGPSTPPKLCSCLRRKVAPLNEPENHSKKMIKNMKTNMGVLVTKAKSNHETSPTTNKKIPSSPGASRLSGHMSPGAGAKGSGCYQQWQQGTSLGKLSELGLWHVLCKYRRETPQAKGC